MLVDRAERLVDLDEGTVRQLVDDTGFDTVLEYLAVVALQADADAVGDEVRQRRQHDQADTTHPGHCVQRDVEVVGNQVVTTGDGQQRVEHERHAPMPVRTGTSRGRCSRLW